MRAMIVVSWLMCAVACGGGGGGDGGGGNLADDEGYLKFTVSGERLAGPVTFEGVSERLLVMLAADDPAVSFRDDPIAGDVDGFTLDQLTMTLPDKTVTTHASGTFKVTVTISGPMNEDGSRTTFSIKSLDQGAGTIRTTAVGERLRGELEIVGSPTQINGKDLNFAVVGDFDFAKCPGLFCF